MHNDPQPNDDIVIYRITRQNLLETGSLIDVSKMARVVGFAWPVAITKGVQAQIASIPHVLIGIASERGRLWDVLSLALGAIQRADPDGNELHFKVLLPTEETIGFKEFKLVFGPGDEGEPVMTLLLPDED